MGPSPQGRLAGRGAGRAPGTSRSPSGRACSASTSSSRTPSPSRAALATTPPPSSSPATPRTTRRSRGTSPSTRGTRAASRPSTSPTRASRPRPAGSRRRRLRRWRSRTRRSAAGRTRSSCGATRSSGTGSSTWSTSATGSTCSATPGRTPTRRTPSRSWRATRTSGTPYGSTGARDRSSRHKGGWWPSGATSLSAARVRHQPLVGRLHGAIRVAVLLAELPAGRPRREHGAVNVHVKVLRIVPDRLDQLLAHPRDAAARAVGTRQGNPREQRDHDRTGDPGRRGMDMGRNDRAVDAGPAQVEADLTLTLVERKKRRAGRVRITRSRHLRRPGEHGRERTALTVGGSAHGEHADHAERGDKQQYAKSHRGILSRRSCLVLGLYTHKRDVKQVAVRRRGAMV